jgi:hypothetical protein
MAFGDFFLGSNPRTEQISRFKPQQISIMDQLGQRASQGLKNLNLGFSPIRENEYKQFQTRTVPGLLERLQFSGGAGTGNSSALGEQLGGAAQDLHGQLAAQEAQYNLAHQNALMNQLNMALQPQYDTVQHSAQPGLAQYLMQGLGAALPVAAGAYFGAPAAAGMAGLGALGALGSSFSGSQQAPQQIHSSPTPYQTMPTQVPQFMPQLTPQQQLINTVFGGNISDRTSRLLSSLQGKTGANVSQSFNQQLTPREQLLLAALAGGQR